MFQNKFHNNQMNNQTNNVYDNTKYNTNFNTNKKSNTVNIKRINNNINSPKNEGQYEPKFIDRNKYIDYRTANERKTINVNNNIIHNLNLYNPVHNNSEIKAFNIETPYKNKTGKHYNFSSERKTVPYQITEKKIIVPQKYDINTFTYINKNNRPDLNLNLGDLNLTLDQPPHFEYNQQMEFKKKNAPYKKVRVNPNLNNQSHLSFIEGNQSVIDNNLANIGVNELSLNLDNSVFHNKSFDFLSKSQSPAYRKKNIRSYHRLNSNDSNMNQSSDTNNSLKKSNYSLFKGRETEIYDIYAKKIQKIFRGYLSRKKFFKNIKMINRFNILDSMLKDHLKKDFFENLIKNNQSKGNSKTNNNKKYIYKKKPSISDKKNESFSIQRKRSNSGGIILVDEISDINYQKKLKEYELELNLLKEENNKLRIINTQRYDNIQEINLENQKLKEKYRNLSTDLDKTKEKILNLELNNTNNENINNTNNIKVIQIDNSNSNNNDDFMSLRNVSPRNLMRLKNIYLKQFFWKKDAMNQKILPKYFERWLSVVEKNLKKEELIEKKKNILLKYVRNRDNFLFLFMKEQFKKFLFNGIMKENIYLRKEQKKEILDKIENEENDSMKKRKLLRFLVFGKIRAINNIMIQQFRTFYFNGLYNQMKNEKDIDLRQSMNIDLNLIKKQKEIKDDSLFNDEKKNQLNNNNEQKNKQLNNDNNDENESQKNNQNEKKKIDLFKKIFLKKRRNDKEFLHKCFIKFYYREIYRELVFKKNSSNLSTSIKNNSSITNSSNLNSNNLNGNNINSNNLITNSNIENPKLVNSNIDNSQNVKNEEMKNEKTENIEKEQKTQVITIEVNSEEIEQKKLTKRLEKARNLRKFLVNQEKEKKEKIRTYFYKFYKAGIIRVMRLEGKKRKASRQNSLNKDYSNTLNNNNYNINTNNEDKINNINNTTPSLTQSLFDSIEVKTKELKMTKLEDLLYKKNRQIKLILKSVIENWNLKSHLFKLRRSSSSLKRKKSSSKGKKMTKNQSSKNIVFQNKNDAKIKSKAHKFNLIPKCKSQSSLRQKDIEMNYIEILIKKIDEVILNYYKRIFYQYLENLE